MSTAESQSPLPNLTITYQEWKNQQKERLPNYDPPRTLLPIKKPRRNRRGGMGWSEFRRPEQLKEQPVRKKKKTSDRHATDSKITKMKKRSTHQLYQIFVTTPLNTKLCLQLDSRTLVRTLRRRVAREMGLDASKLQLMVTSTPLCDALSLEENGVENESNVEARITDADGLCGGADDNTDSKAKRKQPSKLSEKELIAVASEVADIHGVLATYLDIPKGRVDQIREDHRGFGIQHVVFVMLVKWQQSLASSSDFRRLLAAALQKCQRVDLSEKVLEGRLVSSDENQKEPLDVAQCQEELRWTYINSICHLPKYPWDETEWINIGDIYTDVSLLVEQPSPCQPLKVPLKSQDEIFTHEAASGRPSTRIIIQGEAGTGKSTLMVKYVYDWARRDSQESSPIKKFKLVFLLRMRDLDESSNLEKAIVRHLLPQDTSITASQLRSFIKDHPEDCCVILDGYDELTLTGSASATSETSIVQMIHSNVLRKCCLIMSSRPANVSQIGTHLKEYKQLEVRGFSKDKVIEYIKNFFGPEETILATSLIEYIDSNNLIGFAAAPLITRLLCLYWQNGVDSRDTTTLKSLFSVGKLHDALFEFLEEHYFSKPNAADDFDMEKLIVDLGIGRMALRSLWPPNSQLVFPWDEMVKEFDEETIRKACAIGLLHKQHATQSEGRHSKRRTRLSSWKKVATVEFLHKTVQEKCAGEFLAHLGDSKEEEFRTMMQALQTSTDALTVKMILLFACGASKKAATLILEHLTELFKTEFYENTGKFFKGELHFKRSNTIQDLLDLCLLCNLECEANLSSELLKLFPEGRIMFSGITPQRASALAYFLSNIPRPNAIKSITIIGVPRKGSFFVPTETMESTTDRAFHEYLEAYSKLSSKELEQKLQLFASSCTEAYQVAEMHGVPTTLASMQMWHVFEDWQKEVHLSMGTFIRSLKNVEIQHLMMRSIPLGPSSADVWQLIEDGELSELTFLSLRQSGLTEEDISKLATCVHLLPKLKYLDICQNEAGKALDQLSQSLTSVNLEVLDLYKMNASSTTMRTVYQNLPKIGKQMMRLHLHYNDLCEEGASIFAESIRNLRELTRLTLPHPKQHSSVLAMQKVCESVAELSKLESLCLSPGSLAVQDFLRMLAAEITKWHSVQQLRVSAPSGCTDTVDESHSREFVKAIATMRSLHTLKLKRIRLTMQSFEDLVKNGREKKFQKLILYCRSFLSDAFTIPNDDFVVIL